MSESRESTVLVRGSDTGPELVQFPDGSVHSAMGDANRPIKRLELKAISDHAFGLHDGDTLLRYLLYEAMIELSPGFKRKMTLIANPRDARILGPYSDLEITFGGVAFLRSKGQVEVLWRYDEAPWLFPNEPGDEVTIRRDAKGRIWSVKRAEQAVEGGAA